VKQTRIDEDFQTTLTDFEPLLDVAEAAALLRYHPRTIQVMAKAGRLPAMRLGKYWRFRRSQLDAWIRQALQSPRQ
jgi:excisionase family DNA binding protein